MRRIVFATILVGRCSLLREGLSRILEAAGFRIVGCATDVANLTMETCAPQQPLLLVLESSEIDGEITDQIALFKERHPAARVAVIADKRRADQMLGAFQAGANVYLSRSIGPEAFIKTLELVMLGETIVPAELLSYSPVVVPDPDDGPIPSPLEITPPPISPGEACLRLSSREDCILRYLIEGASNKIIARRMNIAEATVKAHIKAILRKIRVNNRTQAAIWAVNNFSLVTVGRPENVLQLPATDGRGTTSMRGQVTMASQAAAGGKC